MAKKKGRSREKGGEKLRVSYTPKQQVLLARISRAPSAR